MFKKLFFLNLFVWIFLFAGQSQDLQQPLKPDPAVKYGKLDNGLVYYIRKNREPEKRVELRLAINAGSICEDNDQQGLAHLIEHMCFNGTKHFKKSEIVDFLEKTGVKFGAHLNAYTSFDETVYKLQLPTDSPGIVDSGLLVLEDWAHNVTLDSVEIDKERGVVKEEWRLGLGADQRMRKKYIPVILKGSRYAERLPIGKMEIIDTAHYSTLRRFYKDWYRPDLMAVIVVGDINPDEIEKKIKEHFGSIPNPINEKKRKFYSVPDNQKPLIAIETDDEATYSMVLVMYKHKKDTTKTVGDFRKHLMRKMFTEILSARLYEITQKPSSPFMYSSTNYGNFLARNIDTYMAFAIAKENKIDSALKVLLDENARVEKFGFTQTEFEREKKDILRQYEKMFTERDKQKSNILVQEYLQNFLDNEPYPGIEAEYKMVRELLPTIKLEDLNKLPKEFITDNNQVILITAPKKEGLKIPTKEEVLKIFNGTQEQKLEAYNDEVSDEPLIPGKITPGKIVDISTKDTVFEKWTLSNGMEVYIKSTDFKNDEILYDIYSEGGTSLVPDDELLECRVLPEVVSKGGLGNFSSIMLNKKLAGTIVSLHPYLYDLRHGFSGKTSPKDLETLLQMQYLYFTNPRKDKETFKSIIDKDADQAKFLMNNPKIVYYDSLSKVVTLNSPRTIPFPTAEQYRNISMEKIYDIYNRLFSNAKGFKVFFVGNVDKEKLKPLVEKYLGSIPAGEKVLHWKNVEPGFPDGITKFTVFKGKEPQSMVTIVMKDNYKYNLKNNLTVRTLSKVISIKLREKLREEESGTYGVFVRPNTKKLPVQKYSFMIGFGCAPANVDKLVNSVFDEIKKLQTGGPEAEDMKKAKETFIRERETRERENSFWLNQMINKTFQGDDILSKEEYIKEVNNISPAKVKKFSEKYLTENHFVLGILKPETDKK
jgi:zinc protease